MKPIFCPDCMDMKKVRRLGLRRWRCGRAWGNHLADDYTAVIGGSAIPIAINDEQLRAAILHRPKEGRGSLCTARILPENYDTLPFRTEPAEGITPD